MALLQTSSLHSHYKPYQMVFQNKALYIRKYVLEHYVHALVGHFWIANTHERGWFGSSHYTNRIFLLYPFTYLWQQLHLSIDPCVISFRIQRNVLKNFNPLDWALKAIGEIDWMILNSTHFVKCVGICISQQVD